jgi:hypothetical protein
MALQPKDILLAFKHIALSDQLNRTEKQFAAFITDCYNRKTGRCDPSEVTAAHTLRLHKRTIIRAGNRLVALKLLFKRRHAGHNHCNRYEPNWEMFRELERQYKQRRKDWAERFERSKLSPSECQSCHSRDDKPVIQTSPNNNIQSTSLDGPSNQQHAPVDREGLGNEKRVAAASSSRTPRLQPFMPSPSSQQAAEAAALRRWNTDLLNRFRSAPAYAVIIEALDPELQNQATQAELMRRGGGFACVLRELALRNVLSPHEP